MSFSLPSTYYHFYNYPLSSSSPSSFIIIFIIITVICIIIILIIDIRFSAQFLFRSRRVKADRYDHWRDDEALFI